MPDGTAVMERPINSPVELTDMPVSPSEILPPTHDEDSTFQVEEGFAPASVATELLDGSLTDGPERTIDDLLETVAQMKKEVSGPENPKEVTRDYKPEKPVGRIRKFLKKHPILAPIMAPLAGLAALMMLIARSASKSTKERQGQ